MNNRLFLYVKAFSDLGTFMDMIVINALILQMTGSTAWLSACLLAQVVGGLLSSLWSGVLADRFDRRKLMIISDVARAVLILSLIFMPIPALIVLVRFLIGLANSFFTVSFSAEVPKIFGEDKVLETNSLIARLGSIAMILGFFAGGTLSEMVGYETVLALDGLSFLISAWVLLKMRWETTTPPKQAGEGSGKKGTVRTIWNDLREVKSYLLAKPLLLIVFVVYLIETFGAGSHNVGVPLLADLIDHDNQTFTYGLIWGVWAAGNVLTTMVLPYIRFVKEHTYLACLCSTVLMSTGFILFLSNTELYLVLPFAFLTGVFDAAAVTLISTILQQSDNHIRGRVFGISTLINRLGFGLGFVVVPLLLQALPLAQMVWIMHGLVITVTLIAIVVFLRVRNKLAGQEATTNATTM